MHFISENFLKAKKIALECFRYDLLLVSTMLVHVPAVLTFLSWSLPGLFYCGSGSGSSNEDLP